MEKFKTVVSIIIVGINFHGYCKTHNFKDTQIQE